MANSKLKCKYCKLPSPREIFTRTPKGNFCSDRCIHGFIESDRKRQAIKAKNKAIEKQRARKRVDKKRLEALKTPRDFMNPAQAAVNKYIRLRDKEKPCVSCGATYSSKNKNGGSLVDAGHYRSRGAAGHLRFNVFNIAGQCVKCNRYKSGNAVDFRIELIKRIGLERVERLENDNNTRSFSADYLKRIAKIFNKRARLIDSRQA